jgi:hypothetical protein
VLKSELGSEALPPHSLIARGSDRAQGVHCIIPPTVKLACNASNSANLISHKPKRVPGAVTMGRCVKCQLVNLLSHTSSSWPEGSQCKVSQQAISTSSTRRPLLRNRRPRDDVRRTKTSQTAAAPQRRSSIISLPTSQPYQP